MTDVGVAIPDVARVQAGAVALEEQIRLLRAKLETLARALSDLQQQYQLAGGRLAEAKERFQQAVSAADQKAVKAAGAEADGVRAELTKLEEPRAALVERLQGLQPEADGVSAVAGELFAHLAQVLERFGLWRRWVDSVASSRQGLTVRLRQVRREADELGA